MGAPASIKADDGIAKGGNAAHRSIVVIFKNRYIILKKPETFQDLLAFVSNSFGSNRPISMRRTPSIFNLAVAEVQLHDSYYPAVKHGEVIYFE